MASSTLTFIIVLSHLLLCCRQKIKEEETNIENSAILRDEISKLFCQSLLNGLCITPDCLKGMQDQMLYVQIHLLILQRINSRRIW